MGKISDSKPEVSRSWLDRPANKDENMNTKQLAELAKEVEITDPIDWGYLSIEETQAYELMASHVLELGSDIEPEKRLPIMMAVVTKLLVENFVLNIKLESKQ